MMRPMDDDKALYLPDGAEFLVTMGYVRVPRCTPAAGPAVRA